MPGRNLSRFPMRVAAVVQQGDSLFGSSPFCRRVALFLRLFNSSGRGLVTSYSGEFGKNLCGLARSPEVNSHF